MQDKMLTGPLAEFHHALIVKNQWIAIFAMTISTISFTNVLYQNSSIETPSAPD